MRSLTRRLEALEVVHAEKSRPAPIGVALIPFLPGESYSVALPESGETKSLAAKRSFSPFWTSAGLGMAYC